MIAFALHRKSHSGIVLKRTMQSCAGDIWASARHWQALGELYRPVLTKQHCPAGPWQPGGVCALRFTRKLVPRKSGVMWAAAGSEATLWCLCYTQFEVLSQFCLSPKRK